MTAMPNPAVNRTLRIKPNKTGYLYVMRRNWERAVREIKPRLFEEFAGTANFSM